MRSNAKNPAGPRLVPYRTSRGTLDFTRHASMLQQPPARSSNFRPLEPFRHSECRRTIILSCSMSLIV